MGKGGNMNKKIRFMHKSQRQESANLGSEWSQRI